MSSAVEVLSSQILHESIVWRLTFSCLMQELIQQRRASTAAGSASRPVLRLLLRDRSSLAELERDEHEANERMAAHTLAQLRGNACLHIDLILSQQQSTPMLYSCERVRHRGTGQRKGEGAIERKLICLGCSCDLCRSRLAASAASARFGPWLHSCRVSCWVRPSSCREQMRSITIR